MEDKKSIWNSAGSAGLILGGIGVAYILLNWALSLIATNGVAGILASVGSILLWVVKFGACIWFMKFCMTRYSDSNPEANHGEIFKFGMLVALLSAIIYSGAYSAYLIYLAPDQLESALDMLRENPMLDANSLKMVEQIIPKMPTISFFMNIVYCWLFGTVLSAIFSRNIPSSNPFE